MSTRKQARAKKKNQAKISEQDILHLALPAALYVENLSKGIMSLEQGLRLAMYVVAVGNLSKHIGHEEGIDATREAIFALNSIVMRHDKWGKFGATGDELGVLKQALPVMEEVISQSKVIDVKRAYGIKN